MVVRLSCERSSRRQISGKIASNTNAQSVSEQERANCDAILDCFASVLPMWVNCAVFSWLSLPVNTISSIAFGSVPAMVFVRICGCLLSNDSIFTMSMSSMVQLKAMHISVISLNLILCRLKKKEDFLSSSQPRLASRFLWLLLRPRSSHTWIRPSPFRSGNHGALA